MKSRLLGAAFLAALAPATADAAFIFTVTEQGSDISVIGSGTLNIAELSNDFVIFTAGSMQPAIGVLAIRGDGRGYAGLAGPDSFGPGGFAARTSDAGSVVGIFGRDGWLIVPDDYASGDLLVSFAVFENASFGSLGLTPGTYVWTWGRLDNADSLTVRIVGGTADVPVSATSALLGASLLGFTAMRRRKTSASASKRGTE